MQTKGIKAVCFFGAVERGYPRSEVLRKGLTKREVSVVYCATSPRRSVFTRYPLLLYRYMTMKRDFNLVYVPEFRHKDVPLAFVLAKLTGKRLVFDPLVSRYDTKIKDRGDAEDNSLQAWHNRNLDRISLSLPDLILADTKVHADYYADEFGVARRKIRVLPVGFDDELFIAETSETSDKSEEAETTFTVLFFGNYLPLHGVDVIVDAAAKLQHVSDVRFVLIGGGQTYQSVAEKIDREQVTNIELRPRVPISELPRLIARAQVSLGIFGTTAKAGRVIANKVYQSMAVRTPVITADSRAIRERFADGTDICLVPAGDGAKLADRILFLKENPNERRRIGENAAKKVHEQFTTRAIADTFLEYCREVLGNDSESPGGDWARSDSNSV